MQAVRSKPTGAASTWRLYQTLFVDHLEATNKAPMTIRTYTIAIDQLGAYLESRGMLLDPTAVTREYMVEFMRSTRRPKDEGGLGLAAASALQRYRSLSVFFKWLVQTDEISESPMAKMSPPHLPDKMIPVVADDDLRKLLKVVGGKTFEARRDKAIISLFIDTGVRLAEAAGIQLEDADLEEREIVVMGKGRRDRRIGIVRETRTDLQWYLLMRSRHPYADEPWLWLGRKGKLTANGIYLMLKRRCKEAGIDPIHPHQLRHTFAHRYLANGGNEGDLMKVTGWRSRSMVDRYGASAASARAIAAHDLVSPRKGL